MIAMQDAKKPGWWRRVEASLFAVGCASIALLEAQPDPEIHADALVLVANSTKESFIIKAAEDAHVIIVARAIWVAGR